MWVRVPPLALIKGVELEALRSRTQESILARGFTLAVLNILDVFSTHLVFTFGGSEANPVADLFIHSPMLAICIKMLAVGLIVWAGYKLDSDFIGFGLLVISLVYLCVVLHNFSVAIQLS